MIAHDRYTLDAPGADPDLLWALAADTNRSSRAMGLAPGRFRREDDGAGGERLVGEGRQIGLRIAWVSGPDCWIGGSWYRSVRRFLRGPVRLSEFDYRIERTGSGCRIEVERRLDGSPIAIAFDRVVSGPRLRRYFEACARFAARPVEPRPAPAAARLGDLLARTPSPLLAGGRHPTDERELAVRLRRLDGARVLPDARERLVGHLREGADEELARLDPFALADRWGVPRRELLRLFVRATHAGLLRLHWGLRCATCRLASEMVTSLRELPDQSRCPGCGATFGSDLDGHVEARFSVEPALRAACDQTYCTAGAPLRPHVFAQLVAEPGRPIEARARLEGELLLRVGPETLSLAPPHPGRLAIAVRGGEPRFEVGPPGDGETEITFSVEEGRPALALLERAGWQAEWVSAALLLTLPEFHELFSEEAPRSRHEVSAGEMTLVFTDLRGSTALYERVGDARAFSLVQDHFDKLAAAVDAEGGALVKTMGDAVMAVFQTAPAAVRAALAMHRAIADSEAADEGLVLKLGLHAGPCLAVRANGRLDFFGQAVNLAARAQAQSHGGDIVATDAVVSHPGVPPLLADTAREPFVAVLKGIAKPQRLWRLRPPPTGRGRTTSTAAAG